MHVVFSTIVYIHRRRIQKIYIIINHYHIIMLFPCSLHLSFNFPKICSTSFPVLRAESTKVCSSFHCTPCSRHTCHSPLGRSLGCCPCLGDVANPHLPGRVLGGCEIESETLDVTNDVDNWPEYDTSGGI